MKFRLKSRIAVVVASMALLVGGLSLGVSSPARAATPWWVQFCASGNYAANVYWWNSTGFMHVDQGTCNSAFFAPATPAYVVHFDVYVADYGSYVAGPNVNVGLGASYAAGGSYANPLFYAI
ncbi:hypothetical protein AB0J86_22330 [Micromonospora sp. NPDC049559]|uniref:hypothetical protein n=1 Tax=Micromonospora sp. NPDC049559 TaxID=3155923 RepID=UPI0034267E3F